MSNCRNVNGKFTEYEGGKMVFHQFSLISDLWWMIWEWFLALQDPAKCSLLSQAVSCCCSQFPFLFLSACECGRSSFSFLVLQDFAIQLNNSLSWLSIKIIQVVFFGGEGRLQREENVFSLRGFLLCTYILVDYSSTRWRLMFPSTVRKFFLVL